MINITCNNKEVRSGTCADIGDSNVVAYISFFDTINNTERKLYQPVYGDFKTSTAYLFDLSGNSITLTYADSNKTRTELEDLLVDCCGCVGGDGTVTSFSAGNLSPLFTTNVATPTTTPALSFNLSNCNQYQVFGRVVAGTGAPSYVSLNPIAFNGLSLPNNQIAYGTGSGISSNGNLKYNGNSGLQIGGGTNTAYCAINIGNGVITNNSDFSFVLTENTANVISGLGNAVASFIIGSGNTITTGDITSSAYHNKIFGFNNSISAAPSKVAYYNFISGRDNIVTDGYYTNILGHNVTNNGYYGCLALTDYGGSITLTASNQFTARFSGGYRFMKDGSTQWMAIAPTTGYVTINNIPTAASATDILVSNGGVVSTRTVASLGIPVITPAALTKTNDTNVTLTLGGTPATALLEAVSLTLGWTGILAIGRGGTGLGTLGTVNQLLRVNSGGTALEYFSPTWTSNTGTVTSVAASVGGTALGVSGTPITSSGTLAFSWTGTSGQYVRGDGVLQAFPTIPSVAGKYVALSDADAGYSGQLSAVNLNDYTKTQVIYSNGDVTNNPNANSYVVWIGSAANTYGAQMAINPSVSDKFFFRNNYNTSWSSWYQVASREWVISQNYITSGSVSVALALPSNTFDISGSPVTSLGTLTGAFKSQIKKTVLAAPWGADGTPIWRQLQTSDLQQNGATTGQVITWNGTEWAAANPPGGVTSVAAGNGMNFTTITATGSVVLGTPSSITLSSTNSVTSTSHTHAFVPGGTSSQYIRGDGVLQTFPTIPSNAVWKIQGGSTDATTNTDNIYHNARVRIGDSTVSSFQLSVVGQAYISSGAIINNSVYYSAYASDAVATELLGITSSNLIKVGAPKSGSKSFDIYLPNYTSSRAADTMSAGDSFLFAASSGVMYKQGGQWVRNYGASVFTTADESHIADSTPRRVTFDSYVCNNDYGYFSYSFSSGDYKVAGATGQMFMVICTLEYTTSGTPTVTAQLRVGGATKETNISTSADGRKVMTIHTVTAGGGSGNFEVYLSVSGSAIELKKCRLSVMPLGAECP